MLREIVPKGLPPISRSAYLFAVACVAVATLVRVGFGWLAGDTLLFASYFPRFSSQRSCVERRLAASLFFSACSWSGGLSYSRITVSQR
jgi:hypothetical protein